MRSRLRFIIAISLAVVLGAWLAWTSLGGSLETYAGPGELATSTDSTYRLHGRVAEGAPTDAAARAQSAEGLRFVVVDKEDPTQKVAVLYRGTVPDQFKAGREVESSVCMAIRVCDKIVKFEEYKDWHYVPFVFYHLSGLTR